MFHDPKMTKSRSITKYYKISWERKLPSRVSPETLAIRLPRQLRIIIE